MLRIIAEGFELVPVNRDPYRKARFRLLGVFAQLEAEMAQQWTRDGIAAIREDESYHHGPAPLCFETDDGRPIEADNSHRVVILLDVIGKGDLSKRKGARELGTSRATIDRSRDRNDLSGLWFSMPAFDDCGAHITGDFARVFGNNDGEN